MDSFKNMLSLRRKAYFEILYILFFGLTVSFVLIKLLGMEDKLIKIFIIALSGLVFLLIIPFREKFLLLSLVFLLPLDINKFIVFETINRVRELQGFAISGFDFFLFPLIFLWIYRLTVNHTVRIYFFPHITIPYFLIFNFSFFGLFNSDIDVSLAMKYSALIQMFKCWIVFLYTANKLISEDKEIIYLIIGTLLLTGLFQAFIGIGQYITNEPLGLGILGERSTLKGGQGLSRVGGTIGQPNKYALFLGMLLQINMACLFIKYPIKKCLMYLIPFIPMLIAIFASYSRSGWFSFLAGGVINCSWCLSKRTGKKFFSICIVFLCFIFFSAVVFSGSESVRNRILSDDKGASEVRKPLAEVAWNVIEDRPLLGIGLNDYTSCYTQYDDTSYWVSIEFPEVVHNSFLLIAAELGIPSLICFLYIIAYLLISLIKISSLKADFFVPYFAIGCFSGWISWIAHSQKDYEYIFFMPRFWFNVGLIVAILYSVTLKTEYNKTA